MAQFRALQIACLMLFFILMASIPYNSIVAHLVFKIFNKISSLVDPHCTKTEWTELYSLVSCRPTLKIQLELFVTLMPN